MKYFVKYIVNGIPFVFILLTACIGKNSSSTADKAPDTDTSLTALVTNHGQPLSEGLGAYLGNYESICDLDTTVHLMQLSVFKKDNDTYITYKYPDKHLALDGKITKDTINFDPAFNIWTFPDKKGLLYSFLFLKEDAQPTVKLLNEDSKPVFESSKCAIGKAIIFKPVGK